MIAAIGNAGKPPCVVYWTGRVGLSVSVITYCRSKRNAADGVLQVPDEIDVCPECDAAVTSHNYPPTPR